MCTLSLYRDASRYVMTMNRDERHERGEYPPHTTAIEGGTMAFPVDAQAGGTWFGTNSYGVTAGLLNSYQNQRGEAVQSRGVLIPSLLAKGSYEHCIDWMQAVSLEAFDSFDMIIAGPQASVHCFWDGKHKQVSHISSRPWFFITSSSKDFDTVNAIRHSYFQRWSSTGDVANVIDELHRWKSDDLSASINMYRSYSRSKSISQATHAVNTPFSSPFVNYISLV